MEKLDFNIKAIGIIHSPYKEKFTIPRQPALNDVVIAKIELLAPYSCEESILELESFSHIWIQFIFHAIPEKQQKMTVRPPRLGGNKRVGVFASRSGFRPNRLGLSLVKIKKIYSKNNHYFIEFSGVDVLDKTPVIDIKPYIPYSDNAKDASAGYAQSLPDKSFDVVFDVSLNRDDRLFAELRSILKFDIRPAYKQNQDGEIRFCFADYEIVASVSEHEVIVRQINL